MNLNKVGIYVKKNLDGVLSTLLGITTKSETKQPKLRKLAESIDFGVKSERILLEAEVKKSQAIELFRERQKC
jgi:hypothetical protein